MIDDRASARANKSSSEEVKNLRCRLQAVYTSGRMNCADPPLMMKKPLFNRGFLVGRWRLELQTR